ncbi:TetR/AcrR family transcriptional regulator [Actinomadura macrotermitis]|uniref:HTH-type transcriptional regulator BetI n=1 Tax=Actinomadura macrotermitis TaxID=2585200 RepID=A0A7K0C1T9_9ACTN|nr:TetR/AcrR family transcriptional regulator [Actinomadura macrotermitis]MQY07433.1 HTH-type transcriptional regulator BetI [Actinomadura macrotermitis]
MPARGDHEARRRDVSAAVWRVLASRGFDGLTLRAVAAEMGASTGLLTHYFPNKKALLTHALDLADEHTEALARRTPAAPGAAALRAALLDVLPLTEVSAAMNRVWVSSWDGALGDPDLGTRETARYERWRGRLRVHAEAARERGELPADADVDDIVATVAAFTHGLVVQALFDTVRFPPERQIALLDDLLSRYFITPER